MSVHPQNFADYVRHQRTPAKYVDHLNGRHHTPDRDCPQCQPSQGDRK